MNFESELFGHTAPSDTPTSGKPVTVIMAFQGWNDVAGAALTAIDHLREVSRAEEIGAIDPEEFYDFQVNQPRIEAIKGQRQVTWRTTTLFKGEIPALGDVILVRGIEPSYRWKAFQRDLFDALAPYEVTRYVFLGIVPGEVPHTRPFPVTVTSPQEVTRPEVGAEPPTYEGPTGIVGVLIDSLGRQAAPVVSLWALIPQYAMGGPAPKAALALLTAFADVVSASVPLRELEDESHAWERGVAELASADPEISRYVEGLEQALDVAEHPEASGDAIARRFEQFLKRRDDGAL